MSNDKKLKGIRNFLLAVVICSSVIALGYLINENKHREWADWTGIGETKVITKKTEKDKQGQIKNITINEQTHSGKTLWDFLELGSRLLIPVLIFLFGLWFQKREKEKAKQQTDFEREKAKQQTDFEREIAKNNLAEEEIQAYLKNMDEFLIDETLKQKLFSDNELKLILDEKLRKELGHSIKDKVDHLDKNNLVRNVVRTKTTTILKRLEGDKERQGIIIHFLQTVELDKFIFANANLSNIKLPGARLLLFPLSVSGKLPAFTKVV